MAAQEQARFIRNLQVLRFVAAFWVVLHHARPPVIPADAMAALGGWFVAVADAGFFGVDIFFVLSGAVMAESTRHLPAAGMTAWRFALVRFARIFAGWWPFFLLYVVALRRPLDDKDLLSSFFLLPMPLQESLLPITWTLSYELYFYAALSLVLLLPGHRRTAAIAGWATVVAAAAAWNFAHGLYTPARLGDSNTLYAFVFSPLVLEFAAGYFLCRWLRERPPGAVWPWLMLAAVAGFAAVQYQWHGAAYESGMAGFYHTPERALLLGACACGLVGAALASRPWQGPGIATMERLGDASYATYLGHILVINTAYYVMRRIGWPATGLAAFAGYAGTLAAVLVYSWLHHRWIERPLYDLARRWIAPKQRTAHA